MVIVRWNTHEGKEDSQSPHIELSAESISSEGGDHLDEDLRDKANGLPKGHMLRVKDALPSLRISHRRELADKSIVRDDVTDNRACIARIANFGT